MVTIYCILNYKRHC